MTRLRRIGISGGHSAAVSDPRGGIHADIRGGSAPPTSHPLGESAEGGAGARDLPSETPLRAEDVACFVFCSVRGEKKNSKFARRCACDFSIWLTIALILSRHETCNSILKSACDPLGT